MGKGQRAIWSLAVLVLLGAMVGCGGDSGTSTNAAETVGDEREYPWVTGAAREFLIPDGDNLIQTFGEEASAAEREQASKVVHIWMKARVAEDWVTDCRHLSRKYLKILLEDVRGVTEGRVTTCPRALEYFGDAASGTSGETLTGPIDSLRVRSPDEDGQTGWHAWAQWHGPKGIDWVLPLQREDGTWKVSVAAPIYRTQ